MGSVIGLIPAAGLATRIGPLPCSKELFPIGFRDAADGSGPRPVAVCHYLLERMRGAGIERVFVILRDGKWDIPRYLGDGAALDLHIGYLMMGAPFGTAFTLDQAYPFSGDARIALGFPDIVYEPRDALGRLLAHQEATGAAVVLGLFQADEPHRADMVRVDAEGRAREIQVKPGRTDLRFTWVLAVWTPVFSRFLNETVREAGAEYARKDAHALRELYVGDVIQRAISAGLEVQTVPFPRGHFVDIGSPESLVETVAAAASGGAPFRP